MSFDFRDDTSALRALDKNAVLSALHEFINVLAPSVPSWEDLTTTCTAASHAVVRRELSPSISRRDDLTLRD